MVRLYNHEEDYRTISEWSIEYDIIPPAPEELPTIGVISTNVCGFLYQTDSKKCFIENFIARRYLHTDAEILEVTEALAEIGKRLGFREISGITRFPLLIRLADQTGYVVLPKYSLVKRCL
jgi:hypothetical protein